MESKVPLPTDNVYKFYALFSLVLLLFSIGSTLYLNRTTNESVVTLLVELEGLKAEPAPTPPQTVRRQLIERQLEILGSDKVLFKWALAVVSALGVAGMIYGFGKWHSEIQPRADEMARVQLELAKLQLARLQRDEHTTT